MKPTESIINNGSNRRILIKSKQTKRGWLIKPLIFNTILKVVANFVKQERIIINTKWNNDCHYLQILYFTSKIIENNITNASLVRCLNNI